MTDIPTREAVRDLIAERLHRRFCAAGKGDECHGPTVRDVEDADAVVDLFEVDQETWLIATVPGANGPVDIKTQIRMPDREPVSHTRFVLRTEPVPVRPGEASGAAS